MLRIVYGTANGICISCTSTLLFWNWIVRLWPNFKDAMYRSTYSMPCCPRKKKKKSDNLMLSGYRSGSSSRLVTLGSVAWGPCPEASGSSNVTAAFSLPRQAHFRRFYSRISPNICWCLSDCLWGHPKNTSCFILNLLFWWSSSHYKSTGICIHTCLS